MPSKLDLTGHQYGEWRVIAPATNYPSTSGAPGGTRWECLCTCGEIRIVRTNKLRTGESLSCGHVGAQKAALARRRSTGVKHPRWLGVGSISKTRWTHMRNSALKRGHLFEITMEYAWGLFEAQGGRCALSGVLLDMPYETGKDSTASLDRIDSSVGYLAGNVQWVHKNINLGKRSLTDSEFIAMCRTVVAYQDQLNDAEVK